MSGIVRDTTLKPRSGRTPVGPGSRSDVNSESSPSKVRSRIDVSGLNFKEKLELLENFEEQEDSFDVLLALVTCDDLHEEYVEEPKRRSRNDPSSTIAKNLQSQFDLESDSYAERDQQNAGQGGSSEDFGLKDAVLPDVVQIVLKSMKTLDELSKAWVEEQDAELDQEMRKGKLRLDQTIATMEAKVIPALEKVFKAPARFHDMARREPPENGIACHLEDQKKFVESLMSLSECCSELKNLKISSKDFEGKCDTLEQLANYVDSNLDGQGAEKLKLKNFEKFLITEKFNTTV